MVILIGQTVIWWHKMPSGPSHTRPSQPDWSPPMQRSGCPGKSSWCCAPELLLRNWTGICFPETWPSSGTPLSHSLSLTHSLSLSLSLSLTSTLSLTISHSLSLTLSHSLSHSLSLSLSLLLISRPVMGYWLNGWWVCAHWLVGINEVNLSHEGQTIDVHSYCTV